MLQLFPLKEMSKGETINLLRNADLSKKVEHYKVQIFFITYKR